MYIIYIYIYIYVHIYIYIERERETHTCLPSGRRGAARRGARGRRGGLR